MAYGNTHFTIFRITMGGVLPLSNFYSLKKSIIKKKQKEKNIYICVAHFSQEVYSWCDTPDPITQISLQTHLVS